MALEVFAINPLGTGSECVLSICHHPSSNLVPFPTMMVTLSVLAPLQIEYDRTGVLRDFLKATSVFDELARLVQS